MLEVTGANRVIDTGDGSFEGQGTCCSNGKQQPEYGISSHDDFLFSVFGKMPGPQFGIKSPWPIWLA